MQPATPADPGSARGPAAAVRGSRARLQLAAAALIALLTVVGAGVTTAAAQTSTPWGQFQGTPDHAGAGGSPRPPYREAWMFREPGSVRGLSGAVIADDVAVAVGVEGVYALELSGGDLRWQATRDGGPLMPPAVADGEGGIRLVLLVEGTGAASALRALDLATGEEIWSVDLPETASGGVTVADGAAFVGDGAGSLHAFDVATGDERWAAVDSAGAIEGPPAVAEGRVYATTLDRESGAISVVAVDVDSGEVAWRLAPGAPGATVSAVTVSGSSVYVGFHAQTILEIDAAEGAEAAFARVAGLFHPLASPALDGDDLIAADRGGGVYRFGSDGTRAWSFQLNEPMRAPPVVGDGAVLAGLEDGRLVAMDADSGRLVWEARIGPGSIGPLALSPERVIASKGGREGGLVAFEHDPDGTLLDRASPTVVAPARLFGNFAVAALVVVLGLFGAARGLALVVTPPGGRLWADEDEEGSAEGSGDDGGGRSGGGDG